jgi:hypothetical protein
MAEALSALPVALGMVRLLKSFGGKPLPIGFVAESLGLPETVARERMEQLADQKIVSLDGGKVTLLST